MQSNFDPTASNFERYRSLPAEVPKAIRAAIWGALRLSTPARVLEIGAGTGRIGKAFVAAGDSYVGVDTSLAMLREFSATSKSCFLAQADGRQLPFRDGTFDVALLMQVLSGIGDWQGILSETRRVLLPGGSVAVGHTISPESGIDAQLKRQLAAILEEMGIAWHPPKESRRQAMSWLESSAVRHVRALAASWNVIVTPQEFLVRHRTGARFAALPISVQEQALKQLAVWAETNFGSLDTRFQEQRSFELDIFEFAEGAGRDFRHPMEDMIEDKNSLLTSLGKQFLTSSLTDASLQQATEDTPDFAILPWVNVVKIGGQSIMDRGRSAVYPLVKEIVANLGQHKMILGTGAGTRARHIYSLAIDLGLPTGVLTVLGTAVAWQNAQMLHYLLAQYGIPFIEPEGFNTLPHYLMERSAVICQGMPPYKLWEPNPATGRIPPQRTDTGCFLISEVFGARKMIYVKDEDGLYTADPKKDPSSKHIPRISVDELLALDLEDLIVERAVLEFLARARNIREIQFVNGLKPGQLTAALNGEPVGTIIYKNGDAR